MKRILLIVAILLTIGQVSAQKNKNKTTYAGIVLSGDDNKPLPGVSVIVSNTVIGTQTDVDGRFRFQGPAHAELSISYLGFETQQIRPQHPLNIKVVLMPDDKLIDEVVVVGYGTARKSELTTASSGLRSRDMVTEGVTSFEQSLQGKLSGVVVTNTEGAPGSSMSMEIRGVASISGTSEPLYVIDGIPMDSDEDLNASQTGRSFTQGLNPMAMLNAQDIESIEILKDASATSIYGSRGANGVVLITTKSGREGRATVNASYSMGFSSLVRMIDVLSPIEYAEYRNWAQGSERYTPEVMATLSNNPHRWQDLIYRTGRTQDYALSVSGGTKKFTYMLSGNYFDQQGIIINSGFSRATFRSNLAFELRPGVRLLSRTNFSRGVYDQVASSTSGADSKQQGIIKQALRMDPAMPKDKDYDPELDGLIDVIAGSLGVRGEESADAVTPDLTPAHTFVVGLGERAVGVVVFGDVGHVVVEGNRHAVSERPTQKLELVAPAERELVTLGAQVGAVHLGRIGAVNARQGDAGGQHVLRIADVEVGAESQTVVQEAHVYAQIVVDRGFP